MATYNCLTAQDYRYQASQIANEIEGKMARWKQWSDQLATLAALDLTALGLTEDEQTQMGSLRASLAALVATYYADDPPGLRTFVRRHAQLILASN